MYYEECKMFGKIFYRETPTGKWRLKKEPEIRVYQGMAELEALGII